MAFQPFPLAYRTSLACLQRTANAWEDDGLTRFAEAFPLPYRFDFDSTNQIVRCRFEGRVNDEQLRNYYSDAAKYVALTGPKAAITDFSGATAVDISRETILELASLPPALPDPQSVRVIVAPSPLIFGLSRMFGMEGERTRPSLHVVRSEQEAWAILGVSEPQFGPYRE